MITELIDNIFDNASPRGRQDRANRDAAIMDGVPRSGIDATPTKKRRISEGDLIAVTRSWSNADVLIDIFIVLQGFYDSITLLDVVFSANRPPPCLRRQRDTS